MSPLRLVTLDVTNTLIKVLGGVGSNYAKVASIYGVKAEPEQLDATFRIVYKQYTTQYPNFGVSHGLTSMQWWDKVAKDTFAGVNCDPVALDRVSKHLYMHFSTSQGWELVPDAAQTIAQIKQAGLRVGVISNFDQRLEKILTTLSLRHYFDFVLCSSDIKIAKPDIEIFKLALEKANVHPEEAIHIGDNVTNDYFGARQAGLNALLLWEANKTVPENVSKEHVIYSLGEILSHLQFK